MYHLVLILICSTPFVNGMSFVGSNDIYSLVYEASLKSNIGEQCRRSLNLYVKNLENISNEDQWALQSEYITKMLNSLSYSSYKCKPINFKIENFFLIVSIILQNVYNFSCNLEILSSEHT